MPESKTKPHAVAIHNVMVKPDLYESLKAQAVERGIRVSEVISEVVANAHANDSDDKAA